MPINQEHPQYTKAFKHWETLRLIAEGSEAVKAQGERFLPIPGGMETIRSVFDGVGTLSEYEAYKLRAMFFEATGRTILGLTGAVLRKQPAINLKAIPKQYLHAVTTTGETVEELLRKCVTESLTPSRQGLLVDGVDTEVPVNPFQNLLGEEGRIAFISHYAAESIINWKRATIYGQRKLSLVVLKEIVSVDVDAFTSEEKIQYRALRYGSLFDASSLLSASEEEASVLGLDSGEGAPLEEFLSYHKIVSSETTAPRYWQEIWEEDLSGHEDKVVSEKDRKFILKRTVFPRKLGGKLWDADLPFVFINADNCGCNISRPVLLPLANMNLGLYRNSADLEHGLHYTALPTAYAAGFDIKPGDKLRIGAQAAWVTDNPNAKAAYLEFTGAGLSKIAEAMADKKKDMAVLGSRLLEEAPRGVEAAETVKLRQHGEKSALANIADTVSAGVSKALEWLQYWVTAGKITDANRPSVKLNTAFVEASMSPTLLAALMGALQAGTISWNTFWYQLQKHEVYPEELTMEDEASLIEAGRPGGDVQDVRDNPLNKKDDEDDEEEEEEEEEEDEEEDSDDEEEEEEDEKKKKAKKKKGKE